MFNRENYWKNWNNIGDGETIRKKQRVPNIINQSCLLEQITRAQSLFSGSSSVSASCFLFIPLSLFCPPTLAPFPFFSAFSTKSSDSSSSCQMNELISAELLGRKRANLLLNQSQTCKALEEFKYERPTPASSSPVSSPISSSSSVASSSSPASSSSSVASASTS